MDQVILQKWAQRERFEHEKERMCVFDREYRELEMGMELEIEMKK